MSVLYNLIKIITAFFNIFSVRPLDLKFHDINAKMWATPLFCAHKK